MTTQNYRLNAARLDEAAKAKYGDTTGYAISKRTGIPLTTVHRLRKKGAEPSLRHLDTLHLTYDIPIAELYLRPSDQAAAA